MNLQQYLSLSLLLCFLLPLGSGCEGREKNVEWSQQVKNETRTAIRPGPPFWNMHAKRFMYAPSFDFPEIKAANLYRFTANSRTDGQTYTFQADNPKSTLSPVWPDLPVGRIKLVVEGLNQEGGVIGVAGSREFYKAAAFNGPYQGAEMNYRESARVALHLLFLQEPVQHWLQSEKPDERYTLYCYPSKIIGAVAEGMLLYAGLSSDDSLAALGIAKRAADFLISISEPAQAPLAFFPPTYRGNELSAATYRGQLMLNTPSEAARIYLDLFDMSGEDRYFLAAKQIADTYLKLQLPSGTWKLKLYLDSGKAVDQNDLIPVGVIRLFDRLNGQYDLDQYQKARDRALEWIFQNPLKTYNWEGQYEDVMPQHAYQNLTQHQACDFALYLLNPQLRNETGIQTARELCRFAEDQFVVWERPLPDEGNSFNWLTPCVLEQYHFYEAVDASAAKLIATYQALHEATGDDLYLAKAISLANNMTAIQKRYDGRYSTWWRSHELAADQDWLNCAVYDARVMLEFDSHIASLNAENEALAQKNLLLLLASPADEDIAAELSRRFRQIEDPVKKADLLRYFVLSDPDRAGPLLSEAIYSKIDTLKVAAIALLGVNRPINDLRLFTNVLESKEIPVQMSLTHGYCCAADNYLRYGNEFLAREYFQMVLQRRAGYFDKRLALKRLEDIGTTSSLKYIEPYLSDEQLATFAAPSWLSILLKDPAQISSVRVQDIIDNLAAASDPALEDRWLPVLHKMGIAQTELIKKAAQDGFLAGWKVAGPFPPAGPGNETPAYFPETTIDFSQTHTFQEGIARWRTVDPYSVFGIVPLADLYGKQPGIAYAYSELYLPQAGDYLIRIGSNDGAACRVNGKWIYRNIEVGRPLKIDEDSIPVRLREGKNEILLKVANRGGNWQACLRICDAKSDPMDLTRFE